VPKISIGQIIGKDIGNRLNNKETEGQERFTPKKSLVTIEEELKVST
jgi:hypothetical protein